MDSFLTHPLCKWMLLCCTLSELFCEARCLLAPQRDPTAYKLSPWGATGRPITHRNERPSVTWATGFFSRRARPTERVYRASGGIRNGGVLHGGKRFRHSWPGQSLTNETAGTKSSQTTVLQSKAMNGWWMAWFPTRVKVGRKCECFTIFLRTFDAGTPSSDVETSSAAAVSKQSDSTPGDNGIGGTTRKDWLAGDDWQTLSVWGL